MAKEVLGRKMREAREARGVRQEEIAEALAVNKKQIGRWERGENVPSGLRLTSFIAYLRSRADAADLEALDRAIDIGVARATVDAPLEPLRVRANAIYDQLSRRPRALERWLTFGEGMAAGIDDTL